MDHTLGSENSSPIVNLMELGPPIFVLPTAEKLIKAKMNELANNFQLNAHVSLSIKLSSGLIEIPNKDKQFCSKFAISNKNWQAVNR